MYLLDLDVSSAFNTITLAFERLLKSPLASAHVKEITIEQMISQLDNSFHQFSLQHEYDSFPEFIVAYLAKIRSKPNKQDLMNVCQEFLHNWKRQIDKSCDLQIFLYCSVIQADNQKRLIELYCFIRKNLFSYQTNLYRSSPLDSLQYGFDEANRLFQLVFSANLRNSIGARFVAIIQKHSKKIYKGEILKGNFIAEYVLHEYLEILMKTPGLLEEIIFNVKQKQNSDRQSIYSFRQLLSARERLADSPDKKKKKEVSSQQQPTLDLQVLDDKPLKAEIQIKRNLNSAKKNASPVKINELINESTQKQESFRIIQVSAMFDGSQSKKSNMQNSRRTSRNLPEQNDTNKDFSSKNNGNKLNISQKQKQESAQANQESDQENDNQNHMQAPPDSPEFALNQAINHHEDDDDDSNYGQSFHLDPTLANSDKQHTSKDSIPQSSMNQTIQNKGQNAQQKDNQLTAISMSLGQVVQSISGIVAEDYSSSLINQSNNHLSFNNFNTQFSSILTQPDNNKTHPRSAVVIDPHPDIPKQYEHKELSNVELNSLNSAIKGNIQNNSQIQQGKLVLQPIVVVDTDSKPIVKRSSNRAATLLSPPKKEEKQAQKEESSVSQAGLSIPAYSSVVNINQSVDQNLFKKVTPEIKDPQVSKQQQIEINNLQPQQQNKQQQQQQFQKQNESNVLKVPEKSQLNQQEILVSKKQTEIEQSKISSQTKQQLTVQQPSLLQTQGQTAKLPANQQQIQIIPCDQPLILPDSQNKGNYQSHHPISSQQEITKNNENNKQKQTPTIVSNGQASQAQTQPSLLVNNISSSNNNNNNKNNNNLTAPKSTKITEILLGSSFVQQNIQKQVDQTKIEVNPGNVRQSEEDGIEFQSDTWQRDSKESKQRVADNQQISSLLNAKMIPLKQNQNNFSAQSESRYTNERLCLSFSKQ